MRKLAAIFVLFALIGSSACAYKTCPTYSKKGKIEQNRLDLPQKIRV